MKPYLEEDPVSLYQTDQKSCTLANWLVVFSQSVDRRHNPRNRIWSKPICLVILSTYISIYLKVEEYETQNKTCVGNEYKREKMMAASFYFHLVTKSCSRWELGFTNILSATQFIFRKWCSIWLKLFVNYKFTELDVSAFFLPFLLLFLCTVRFSFN